MEKEYIPVEQVPAEEIDTERPVYRITEIDCQRCGHHWIPKIPNVRICPECKSPYYDRQLRCPTTGCQEKLQMTRKECGCVVWKGKEHGIMQRSNRYCKKGHSLPTKKER